MNQPRTIGAREIGRCCLGVLALSAAVLFLAFSGYAQTQTPAAMGGQTMTNTDVLKLVQARLSDDLIVSKIRSSKCSFDTSTDTILKLKSQGVSDAVIEAMLGCGRPPVHTPGSAAASSDPNNPLSPHPPGIYWLEKTKTGEEMARLEASSYQGSKSSGMFGSAMSMGLKKAKWKARLAGAHAALRIPDLSPVFWFYFPSAGQGFGQSGVLARASRPEDFALARMESQKHDRELVVGQAGVLGNSAGLRSQDVVTVAVQNVSPGVYKVTVARPLKPGEYCFVPPGGAAAFGMAGGQLYDFEIDRP